MVTSSLTHYIFNQVFLFSPCTWRGTQDVGLSLFYGLSHWRKAFILKTAITNVM